MADGMRAAAVAAVVGLLAWNVWLTSEVSDLRSDLAVVRGVANQAGKMASDALDAAEANGR